ncbi:unnamed protein product [Strongylus vulgaris]|uniref:ATP-dependent NAD(P)H-hydrate dehydratase n=1 Tax=Strongylus vulgaris TaxID=40348 RepID=A0A3P7JPQ8_STRVU|nr:unnamed protein product [Strongylus vulgaris]
MVYVMCAPEAAPVIKTYSPELIVHPTLEPDAVLPVGIEPLPSAILTPNIMEFSRLCEAALNERDVLEVKDQAKLEELASRLSKRLGTSLFVKGKVDFITNPDGKVMFKNYHCQTAVMTILTLINSQSSANSKDVLDSSHRRTR